MFVRTRNGALIHVDEIKYIHQLRMFRTHGYAYVALVIRSNPNDPANPIVSRFELDMPDAKALITERFEKFVENNDVGTIVYQRPDEVEYPTAPQEQNGEL